MRSSLTSRPVARPFRTTLLLAATVAACATASATPSGGPPDPGAAARLSAATQQTRRLHVVFEWSLTDREFRLNGRGVLRVDSAQRARVDLFDPRGNTLAAAIVDGETMRIAGPPGAEKMLPPSNLMWAAIGVFRQPTDAPLVATKATGTTTQLEYARDDRRYTFGFDNEVLRHVEWTAGGSRRTVELIGASKFGLPAEGKFRDWTEFRELTLRATDVAEAAKFDADVWILPNQR
jgi:hypothetical protein